LQGQILAKILQSATAWIAPALCGTGSRQGSTRPNPYRVDRSRIICPVVSRHCNSGLKAHLQPSDLTCTATFAPDTSPTATFITGHSPNPSYVGEAVTITYQVTGDALDPASQVTIDSSNGERCSGSIADGQCTLSFTDDGTFTLTASYAGDANNDPSQSEPVSHTVDAAADLVLSLSNGQSQSIVGQALSYTLIVANPGPSDVHAARVNASAPSGLLWSWSCEGQGGALCAAQGVGDLDDSVSLPAESQVSYTLTATLPESYADTTLSASAEVGVPADVIDPNLANNRATDSDTVILEANSCYGSDVLVTHTTYAEEALAGTIVCAADVSITAHTEVVGTPDSNVTYSAPTITLGPGFRIEAGATFHAGDYQIPPASVSARAPRSDTTQADGAGDKTGQAEIPSASYRTADELSSAQRQLLDRYGIDPQGLAAAVADGEGRYLVIATAQPLLGEDDNAHGDVYALDLEDQTLHLISRTPQGRAGNAPSGYPALDGYGQRIVFQSRASDLVANGDAESDLYLYEPDYAQLTPLTGELDGDAAHPALDGTGEQLLFDHQQENLARTLQGIDLLGLGLEPAPKTENDAHHPALSGDGRTRAWVEEEEGGCAVILQRGEDEGKAYACPETLDLEAVAPLYFEGDGLRWRERE
jgi:hypothetical protein